MCKRIIGKRERKKFAVFTLIVSMILVSVLFLFGPMKVKADPFNSAQEFCNTYGDDAIVFNKDNGYLYFFSRGKYSSASIKYHTLGWQMVVKNSSNGVVDSQYYKLGGTVELWRNDSPEGWSYELYRISASTIKDWMHSAGKSALETSGYSIYLNAGNCKKVNGVDQGSMTDGSAGSGVYWTYNGIANAASWSSTTKDALQSYYDKKAPGLFYTVSVSGSTGISSVSGGGTYFYGTQVTVSSSLNDGYDFIKWYNGNSVYSTSSSYSFPVEDDISLTAIGKIRTYTVQVEKSAGISSVSGGGTYNWGSTVTVNSTVSNGYHFVDWHNKYGGAKTSSSTSYSFTIKENKYLVAKAEGNPYDISYNANGGTGAPNKQTYIYGPGSTTLSSTKPSNKDSNGNIKADFKGWSKTKKNYGSSKSGVSGEYQLKSIA